jgi:Protein of unknown function (DUF4031)
MMGPLRVESKLQSPSVDAFCVTRRRHASLSRMAVYVDNAVFQWRGRRWAHLLADDLDELHAFAARLGMPRRAFQDKRSGAHYDIDSMMRETALRLGAEPVSRLQDRARMRAIIANARRQWSGYVANAVDDATKGGSDAS